MFRLRTLVASVATLVPLVAMLCMVLALPALAAPPRKPPPAPSWEGFYLGGNLGLGWGQAATGTSISGFAAPPGFFRNVLYTIPAVAFSDPGKLRGIIGGGQLGYNHQVMNWIFGL